MNGVVPARRGGHFALGRLAPELQDELITNYLRSLPAFLIRRLLPLTFKD